jgi:phage shock protein C
MRRFEKIIQGRLYRSRDGIILGVCKGIAEHFDFSVFWARVITILILFVSGFWPIVVLYFIAALLMKPEPVIPIQTDEEQEFYDSYLYSRKGAAERLRRRYNSLESRIQRMEHYVTSREFDWEKRMHT